MSDLVVNPEDRFSRVAAPLLLVHKFGNICENLFFATIHEFVASRIQTSR